MTPMTEAFVRNTDPQRAVIEAGVENGGAQSLGGDAVAVSFRDALGEAMEAQPT